MSAKQGNSGNKVDIKKLTLYALLVAICLIVGYLENLLSISLIAIAPGVKIGLSNSIALMLVYSGDKRGAWAVNITRICLSALLFGSLISFVIGLLGGMASTVTACLLSRSKNVSCIGNSIACGTIHNIFQLIAAAIFVGMGVMYYLPVLLLFGAACGAVCGVFSKYIISLKIFNI